MATKHLHYMLWYSHNTTFSALFLPLIWDIHVPVVSIFPLNTDIYPNGGCSSHQWDGTVITNYYNYIGNVYQDKVVCYLYPIR